jgi:hypothetical protein
VKEGSVVISSGVASSDVASSDVLIVDVSIPFSVGSDVVMLDKLSTLSNAK